MQTPDLLICFNTGRRDFALDKDIEWLPALGEKVALQKGLVTEFYSVADIVHTFDESGILKAIRFLVLP